MPGELVKIKTGGRMNLVNSLRTWSDRLEETALAAFLVTDILLMGFIAGAIALDHYNRQADAGRQVREVELSKNTNHTLYNI